MKKMLRWCSTMLLMALVMAAMLLLPGKAAAVPVLTPRSPAAGNCPLGDRTAKEILKMLIDKTNDTYYTETELSGAVVPNLYGGLDIKDGFITDVNRTRLARESYMALGDVVVAEYDGIYEVFIYLGDGTLAKVSSTDRICKLVSSTGEAYSGTNVFATFIAYDQYVILRPSMLG